MVQAYACARDLHPSRHVELVAAEGDDAHRDARVKRLDGYAVATVAHDAGGPLEDRAVRQECLDVGVGWGMERARVERARRHDYCDMLIGERLEGGGDELVVSLIRRRCRDQHDRSRLASEP